ncbi:MAG: hypothetical protein ABIP55_04275, partial [Tepidisphaeraceae bacterium]
MLVPIGARAADAIAPDAPPRWWKGNLHTHTLWSDGNDFPEMVAEWSRHTKNTYLSSQYRRLAGRRGKKRAIVAVGHTMLVMMYHMLKEGMDYQELGHDYLDKLEPQRLTRYLVKRLQALGHEVAL